MLTKTIIAALTVTTIVAQASWPTAAPSAGSAFRVQGTQPASTQVGDFWYSGDLSVDESPLPIGYVAPTPAEAVEIKTYPSVRRAEFASSNLWIPDLMGVSRAFWALFNHIKSNSIPMTSPVEMNFNGLSTSTGFFGTTSAKSWTMAFLYRTPALGPIGSTPSGVVVVDSTEVTVISIGVEGNFDNSLDPVGLAVNQLQALLAT